MWPCQFYIGPIPRGTTVATIAICEIGKRLICGNIVKSDSIAQQLFSDAQLTDSTIAQDSWQKSPQPLCNKW